MRLVFFIVAMTGLLLIAKAQYDASQEDLIITNGISING